VVKIAVDFVHHTCYRLLPACNNGRTPIRAGAFDFITKPVDGARLFAALSKAVDHQRLLRLVASGGHNGGNEPGLCDMVGQSGVMQGIFDVIRRVATADVNVMICGESGTGKELAARAIHELSPRRSRPLVSLNMAAIPKDLVESTLFGHERGAFTGAERIRIGACEEAEGGTLFLDELCEMPLELQAKLLRFLQERQFRRVGGAKDLVANVRVVSATNKDPTVEMAAGRLRADLYYRLNVVPLRLPPLRDRQGDVSLLAMHALTRFAKRYVRRFRSIEPEALRQLEAYRWPGNVRQLYHLIERCVVLHEGESLQASMLPQAWDDAPEVVEQPGALAPALPERLPAAKGDGEGPICTLAELEQQAIRRALRTFVGSPGKAARALGISEATIYRKIKQYSMNGSA